MSWSDAYLRQARSDLRALRMLREHGADKCQIIHYLQMAGEKLAKSESDEAKRGDRPGFSHYGFGGWLNALSLSRREVRDLGYSSQKDLALAKRGLLPTARAIEHLAPKVANDRERALATFTRWSGVGTNAEYPWQEGADPPAAPADYAFDEVELDDQRLLRLANLIDARVAQKLGERRVLPE